uniref:Autophagy protein 5 n=1 Tax=Simocephalus serrulatus TaxID=117539 RepID=A0A4Y7NNT7_9CRUS|nr:EOG090X0BB3 [Simocephalus serrulatus]SVE94433.1 EOG090X0BB3 [Simocephalus serrulatus]
MSSSCEAQRFMWICSLSYRFQPVTRPFGVNNKPCVCSLLCSKISLYSLHLDKRQRSFAKYQHQLHQTPSILWLEDIFGKFDEMHYPIGLLYDLFVTNSELPWQITVHFDKYPDNKILKCSSKDVVEAHLMHSLKEADALKHRNHIMSLMQERDHKQLWLGLLHDRFDQFWSANRKLMDHTAEEGFRHIPFRLYAPQLTSKPFIQYLVKPIENEKKMTIEDLLQKANLNFESKGQYQVVIHGIDIPLETPLQWISEHLSYPDNFLHLCIRYPST